jgi:RNA polymerase sigma-70 factor (ECF subfamily)
MDLRAPSQASMMNDPFRVLFEEHFDYVYRSLRRLGVHERDLEDVTHDVFLQVHAAIARYDGARPAKPWLFAFAFRLASDYRRLGRHKLQLTDVVEGRAHETTDEPLERAETRAMVARAMDELDMAQRAILVLHDVDDVPVPEIADSLGVPLNTAYSRLRSARDAFTAAVRRQHARQR